MLGAPHATLQSRCIDFGIPTYISHVNKTTSPIPAFIRSVIVDVSEMVHKEIITKLLLIILSSDIVTMDDSLRSIEAPVVGLN